MNLELYCMNWSIVNLDKYICVHFELFFSLSKFNFRNRLVNELKQKMVIVTINEIKSVCM